MTSINPDNLQFIAEKRLGGELFYKGKPLHKVGIQRYRRIGRGQGGKIQHFIYYSEYHRCIVYDYWPGARFMMLIAPRHKQNRYLRVFWYGNPGRIDKIWMWLHNYELVDK